MASSVDRRIEGYLTEHMGHDDPASLIRLRSTEPIRACGLSAAPTGRTHHRNSSTIQTREKILASGGPSTHVLGPAEGRTRGAA
jgi:hypothetical protein